MNSIHAELDVQYAVTTADLPTVADFQTWVDDTLNFMRYNKTAPELTLRIVDLSEGRDLNKQWRHRDYATNVLSFPFECPPGVPLNLLGDIVLCAPVVAQEAQDQGKILQAHWAHLVVHGVLHLLGYDHLSDEEAQEMETLEIEILQHFNYPNPYLENS
jgi:probable rRNA maturation factor